MPMEGYEETTEMPDANNSSLNMTYDIDTYLSLFLGPKHLPLDVVIPITVVYVVIFVSGVVGNVAVCVVIIRNPSMHTATNCYLFSLAISDLTVLLLGKWSFVCQRAASLSITLLPINRFAQRFERLLAAISVGFGRIRLQVEGPDRWNVSARSTDVSNAGRSRLTDTWRHHKLHLLNKYMPVRLPGYYKSVEVAPSFWKGKAKRGVKL